MRKVRSAPVLLCVVAVLLLVLASTAGAATKTAASGHWYWNGPEPTTVKYVGDNWFMTGWQYGYWEGTFEGTYTDTFKFVLFKASEERYWMNIHFAMDFTGSVNGVPGTVEMRLTCRPQMSDGSWQVIGGTGGLKHLVGHGTWTFADEEWPGDWAMFDYKGTVWLP